MKWLHKNGETHIDGFDFKKLPRLDKGNEAIRRATLTNDEYEALYRAMRTYTAKHNKLDDAELRVRKIVQHYGRCMTGTERHTQLGKRFIELSEQCHKQINSDAGGWWTDEVRV